MHEYMTTYTKKHFTVLDPQIDDIDIFDIAHALSMIARANGHFSQFYSVAQHSVSCALEAFEREYSVKVCLACLLHDASEAYMGDLIRPLKNELPSYLEAEAILQKMIYRKYLGEDMMADEMAQVRAVDDAMLFHEFKCFMGEELDIPEHALMTHPTFYTRSFSDAEEKFLVYFHKLQALL